MPEDNDAQFVLLGRIAGAHGIRGDVLIKTFTEAPENIATYGPLTSMDGAARYDIRIRRVTPKGVIAGIKGITDRNGAEAIKGTELYVPREKLPEPDDGEIYHIDLIGLAAVDESGEAIGEIVNVANYGGGDLLELRLPGKRATELVPFTREHVPDVDVASGRLTIRWPLQFEIVKEETQAPPSQANDN